MSQLCQFWTEIESNQLLSQRVIYLKYLLNFAKPSKTSSY